MTQHSSAEQIAWERSCHHAITSDTIWSLDAYRAALFLLFVSRDDCRTLQCKRPRDAIASQLADGKGSISANLSEGYSRSTRADRLRFYGYALGSTRECVGWYEAARGSLVDVDIDQRLVLLARIRALVLGIIARERPGTQFEP